MTQMTTIKDVLLQVQTTMQCHIKMTKVLKKIYTTMGADAFWTEFEQLIRFPMVVFNREPTVERTIDFIAKFFASLSTPAPPPAQGEEVEGSPQPPTPQIPTPEDSNPLMMRLFDFLLQHHNAKDRAVRFRACQLIYKLLGCLGDEASIDDALYERVFHCMLERLRDKAAVVRVHAVLALVRLQDPADDSCPLIKAYLFLMTSDPNPEVRKAVVQHIAPCRKTLPAILERTRDVKDTVRQAAFTVVAEKVPLRALSISQRVQLLEQGLNDRAESVRTVCCNKLLQGWLRCCEGNVLDLLHSLDVDNSTQVCCTMLAKLFTLTPIPDLLVNFNLLNDQCVIPRDKLTLESALYWRELASYVHKAGTQYEQHLDMVLPAPLPFCQYLDSVVGELEACTDLDKQLDLEFLIQQLLHLLSCMDLSDQACRKAVEKILHKMLLCDRVGHSLVGPLLPCLRSLRPSAQELTTYLAETVADIREPITVIEKGATAEERRKVDLQVAKVRVKLNQSREELEEAVRSQDFTKAAELKDHIRALEQERNDLMESAQPTTEEVRTERKDPVTVVKCLTIICEMLEALPLQTLTPTLQMLMETQILPGMTSEESSVRNLSVKAIGMCCQLKSSIVMQHLPLLMLASQEDVENVRVTALKSLFDLIHIFGLGAFHDTTSDDKDKDNDKGDDDDETMEEETNDDSRDLLQRTGQSEEGGEEGEGEAGEKGESGWSKTASKLIATLTSALDSESGELRSVVAEGLAKLLMSGRIFSAGLVSRLLLLWYNPLTEDDAALRHTLGTFFPIFAFTNSANQELVEEAFLPTLKTIINAPTTSPLNGVNPSNVADFLVELTHSQRLVTAQADATANRSNPCHDSIAVRVCNEILSNPQSFTLRLWTRVLNQLSPSPDNYSHLKDLNVLCQQMLEVVKEKTSIKALEKFQTTVKELLAPLIAAEQSNVKSPDQTGTPSMPPPASTALTAKSTGRRARTRAHDNSQLDSSLYATPSQKEGGDADVENVRCNLDSLLLDTSKTPRSTRTPGTKRALHTIQDTSLL